MQSFANIFTLKLPFIIWELNTERLIQMLNSSFYHKSNKMKYETWHKWQKNIQSMNYGVMWARITHKIWNYCRIKEARQREPVKSFVGRRKLSSQPSKQNVDASQDSNRYDTGLTSNQKNVIAWINICRTRSRKLLTKLQAAQADSLRASGRVPPTLSDTSIEEEEPRWLTACLL